MDELTRWLKSQGLEVYAASFTAQHVDLALLTRLTEADLKEIGMASLGDRKRLMRAIDGLKPVSGSLLPAASAAAPASITVQTRGQGAPAARRQLTVMFSDLVDSTRLAGRLDPEDWQEVLRAYHEAVAAVVVSHGGHVAQFLGDGALIYFGYPQAHEDDADRSARAALEVVETVAALEPALAPERLRLATRIGIATGQVVVGEIGAGTTAADQSASGQTPNLAARLQAQAQPGEIVLSAQTQRLLGGAFETQALGRVQPKGLEAPVEAWRLIGERAAASRFDAKHVTALSRFVGRDSELAMLRERLQLAREGEGQIVLLSGEAGIGKSRLCLSLRDEAAATGCTTVIWQCSPYFGSSALYPVVQQLLRSAAIEAGDTPRVAHAKLQAALARAGATLATSTGVGLARAMELGEVTDARGGLAPPSGDARPPAVSAENGTRVQTKRQSLEAVLEMLLGLAGARAVLLLIEDAHWIDPTTEELIGLVADRIGSARVLVLITGRPEYLPSWGAPPHLTRLTLSRLGQRQCAALIDSVAGKPLPAEVRAEITARTDGIPLFVEELTRAVLESDLLQETTDGYRLKGPLRSLAIPSTLQDSLMARLDRLSPAKEVAQVGAVIGREFSYRLLAAVLKLPTERLQEVLDELVQSELVFRRGMEPEATYSFKHALVRDTAYNSMLKSQRVLRHGQVATAIEQIAPDTVTARPELLALHHQEGAQPVQAFHYFAIAGRSAHKRSQCPEAVIHLNAALGLLPELPADPGTRQTEFELQLALGGALTQTSGYGSASTLAAYQRAREIALTLPDPDVRVEACGALSTALIATGRCREVIRMFDESDVSKIGNLKPMNLASRHWIVGAAHYLRGNLREADVTLSAASQALEGVDSSHRELLGAADPCAAILLWHSQVYCQQGLLERAHAAIAEALSIGEQLDHGVTRGWALYRMAWISLLRGDITAALQFGQKTLAVAERLALRPRIGQALMVLGRAQLAEGAHEEGLRLARKGFELWTSGGTTLHATESASVIADTLFAVARPQDAAEFISIGEHFQRETEERQFEPELIRQRGLLFEQDADLEAAEAHYRRAIEAAALRGALLFQLRAGVARLRVAKAIGGRVEANRSLRSTYECFPEGFDFPDLVRAREILQPSP